MSDNIMVKILLAATIIAFVLIICSGGWLIYDLCVTHGASIPLVMLAEGVYILAVVGFFVSCSDAGIPGDML